MKLILELYKMHVIISYLIYFQDKHHPVPNSLVCASTYQPCKPYFQLFTLFNSIHKWTLNAKTMEETAYIVCIWSYILNSGVEGGGKTTILNVVIIKILQLPESFWFCCDENTF